MPRKKLRISRTLQELLFQQDVLSALSFDYTESDARFFLEMQHGQREVSRTLREGMTPGERRLLIHLREWLLVGAKHAECAQQNRHALMRRASALSEVLGVDAVTRLGELAA